MEEFEEWLPKPCDCPAEHETTTLNLGPTQFESRVHSLEKNLWAFEDVVEGLCEVVGQVGEGYGKMKDRVEKVEEEVVNLNSTVGVLMIENKELRDRVQQLDSCEAGARFVAQREQQSIKKEVEE